ncbi:hypothetical protein NA56DRAFT_649376 [Hyaloscypha hepaticicola]|uniref:Uncharacterized protein n=1 Tax=Hyaloscypha hepaticicola TaxID=2082293 RepID=A0A2J6PR50_9HELO|nr:hypothetical protein NA56DRAFT_649376 [Hyaloscypha hepaticicola]
MQQKRDHPYNGHPSAAVRRGFYEVYDERSTQNGTRSNRVFHAGLPGVQLIISRLLRR